MGVPHVQYARARPRKKFVAIVMQIIAHRFNASLRTYNTYVTPQPVVVTIALVESGSASCAFRKTLVHSRLVTFNGPQARVFPVSRVHAATATNPYHIYYNTHTCTVCTRRMKRQLHPSAANCTCSTTAAAIQQSLCRRRYYRRGAGRPVFRRTI